MNRYTKVSMMGLLVLLAGSPAWAEQINAVVVGKTENSLEVRPQDMQRFPGGATYTVPLGDETRLEGYRSLDEIRQGDTVELEVNNAGGTAARTGNLNAQTIRMAEQYGPGQKLGRGLLNVISFPIEIGRSIHLGVRDESLAYGWTVGLLKGLGNGAVRFGAGVIDTFTFPFEFPKDNREPLVQPEFAWEKEGITYA